ncbi:MAG: hypothetical protein IJ620_03480 [Bacteroidales bacterium]|nr:hypothetical protein [Bacteroidales bacterium]
MKHKTILMAVAAACMYVCVLSCQQSHSGDHMPASGGEPEKKTASTKPAPWSQDVRLEPGKYVVDEPESVVEYMRTLCEKYNVKIALHDDEERNLQQIWHTLQLLDDYAAGRRSFYPEAEVREVLHSITFELGYAYSHCPTGDEDLDSLCADPFFFRFLEQAVRLSPKVDFVSDFHCADGTAGILNFHEWSPAPLYSFLIFHTEHGLRVTTIGKIGQNMFDKLFHLSDSMGLQYYLCSYNGNGSLPFYKGVFFRQYLFMHEGDAALAVASQQEFFMDTPPEAPDVRFNPNQLRWDICTKKGTVYIRMEGTPSLRLHLDGMTSRFEVIQ